MHNEPDLTADLAVTGHLVTSSLELPGGEVRVRDGRIVAVLDRPSDAPAAERIDVGDAYVLPGVVDPHVHSLSYAGEGIAAATRSAAAGGVTTILEMPFDEGGPIWSVETFTEKRRLVNAEAHVDVGMYATVEPGGEGIEEVAGLAAVGAACFKVSTYHTDPRRFPRTPDDELLAVFEAIAATGRRVCVHAENNEIVQAKVAELKARGELDPRLHCAARPPVTETAAVANVLELGREIGVKLHFCHISTPRAVDLVRQHVRDGSPASLEVCPHYLTLTDADMATTGAWLKCNPPLRGEEHVAGLWERFRADAIDAIASDHAPWPREYKQRANIFDNASGGPGVETLLPVTASAALHEQRIQPCQLVRTTATKVAQRFGLAHRKGDLAVGLDGDLVVLDPTVRWQLDEADLHSHAGWSPFHRRELQGRVTLTVSRGEVVWDGSQVLATPGRGEFLEASYRDDE
ncbi:MAG: amidohydrolase family protein [Streptosporangiales bacterium]|nr:amidohydrolase family protein [Streptosporangiales bacterium]